MTVQGWDLLLLGLLPLPFVVTGRMPQLPTPAPPVWCPANAGLAASVVTITFIREKLLSDPSTPVLSIVQD